MNAIASIIKSVPVPPADLAIVADVNARLVAIGEIDKKCRPDPHQWNQFGWLHFEMERRANELAESPSQAAAEAVHFATTRLRDAGQSIEAIAGSLRVAGDRIRGELAPVVTAIFDAAAEKLAAEISARRAELAKGSVTMFDVAAELAAFDARGVQLAAQLEVERESAMANPVQFLTSHIEPQVALAPAPAPVQPVKSYRGRVRLDKPEPEPTAPDDLLGQLASDEECDSEDPLAILTAGT
jgi:hypothetical protein